ncbi:hypothetical protein Gohar_022362, partial [Gossypium harknessii]|nr:hypothetical protein [Gossypium harknessii]
MVADVEYLPWFRLIGKSYLLSRKGGEGKFSVRGNGDHHSSSIGGTWSHDGTVIDPDRRSTACVYVIY